MPRIAVVWKEPLTPLLRSRGKVKCAHTEGVNEPLPLKSLARVVKAFFELSAAAECMPMSKAGKAIPLIPIEDLLRRTQDNSFIYIHHKITVTFTPRQCSAFFIIYSVTLYKQFHDLLIIMLC